MNLRIYYFNGFSASQFLNYNLWSIVYNNDQLFMFLVIYVSLDLLQLLSYAEAIMLFSDCEVDQNIISWNRLILLHGPPGTGKTSLCKALSHKLAIRMGHRYTHGQLIEINSHSLFSKYFSEVQIGLHMYTFY